MFGNTAAPGSLKDAWSSWLAFATEFLGSLRAQEQEEVSDESLAKRMHDGDDAAFEQLYERYFQKVYAFVRRRVSHTQIAEDLVADVFTKAFAHRRTFVWKTSFSSWIYRIATNRVTDYHRTKKPSEELDEARHDRPDGQALAPEEIDRVFVGAELEAVLEKLGTRDRIALTMKFYSDCSNEEIAKALGCTANNAGVIVYRALKKCESLASETLKAMTL